MTNAAIKDGEHVILAKNSGPEGEKRRKLEENHDLALVGMKRIVENKRTAKL